MKCEKIKKQLALLISGDLPECDISNVKNHLNGCGECSNELESLREVQSALNKIVESDTPEPLPQHFNLIIHNKIIENENKHVYRIGKGLKLFWGKPALILYGFIVVFCLGIGLSWHYWKEKSEIAKIEYLLVQPAVEKFESKLGEKVSFRIFEGASLSEVKALPSQPCVYLIICRTMVNNNVETFSLDYSGESDNLQAYRRYPWITQRENKLIDKAGSLNNIYVIICPMPNTSRQDRQNLKKLLLTQFESSFKKGI